MDPDSDGGCSSKKDNTLWNKLTLGISATSKSIFRTPAQQRLLRLRNKLVEDQKKNAQDDAAKLIQSMKSDLVQLRSSNDFGAKTSLAQRKPKSEKSSLQARLKRCVERPAKESTKTLIPPKEICNQVNLMKSLDPRERIRKKSSPKSSTKTSSPQEKKVDIPSPRTLSDLTKNNSRKSSVTATTTTLKDITKHGNVEVIKSRKRRSKETEENPIQEKILRKETEGNPIQEKNLRKRNEKSPLQVKDERVSKKLSANDRLQKLRDSLKKQKDKKGTDSNSIDSSAKSANETHFKPFIEPAVDSHNEQFAAEKMDVDEDAASTFKEQDKTEPVPCTSLSSNIASFFRSFRNEIASAFTSHSENINIREKYNKTINKVKSKNEISEKDCIYVIPDTNIFIHHLTFIKDILEQPVQNNKTVRIFVPYIVIEELDRLKEQRDKSVSTTAMRAVKYLNEKLENHDVSLQGQTIVDSIDHLIPVKYPDDSILNCCLQMKRKGNKFLLLSNDINLRNKALVNNVKALSSADVDVENIVKFC